MMNIIFNYNQIIYGTLYLNSIVTNKRYVSIINKHSQFSNCEKCHEDYISFYAHNYKFNTLFTSNSNKIKNSWIIHPNFIITYHCSVFTNDKHISNFTNTYNATYCITQTNNVILLMHNKNNEYIKNMTIDDWNLLDKPLHMTTEVKPDKQIEDNFNNRTIIYSQDKNINNINKYGNFIYNLDYHWFFASSYPSEYNKIRIKLIMTI